MSESPRRRRKGRDERRRENMNSWVVHSEVKPDIPGVSVGDRVVYVITVDDVATKYNELHDQEDKGDEGLGEAWDSLPPETQEKFIHQAERYMEGLCSDGTFTFADAIEDAIRDVENT